MRILVDYRPALRARTGVGEYAHQLALALAATRPASSPEAVSLFSSSWKDRFVPDHALGASAIDRRIPVRALNYLWHRWSWPPVELLTGQRFDVVHSMHPLLMPSREAATLVTIHDLDFLDHPERVRAEIRRDYAALARAHAARAHRVVAVSRHTADDAANRLGIERSKISIVSPVAPDWPARAAEPADGYILFMGTLEARKNVSVLLDAYATLIAHRPHAPRLVLAGRATPDASGWLARAAAAPLAGHVDVLGYVDAERRRSVYEGALALVMPSHHEGFGIPALEAMTLGVPVIVADRGALPEVTGDASLLFDPSAADALTAALTRVIDDGPLRQTMRARGFARARAYQPAAMAAAAREAWALAIEAKEAQRRAG